MSTAANVVIASVSPVASIAISGSEPSFARIRVTAFSLASSCVRLAWSAVIAATIVSSASASAARVVLSMASRASVISTSARVETALTNVCGVIWSTGVAFWLSVTIAATTASFARSCPRAFASPIIAATASASASTVWAIAGDWLIRPITASAR